MNLTPEQQREKHRLEKQALRHRKAYEEAIASLPTQASHAVEIEWVRTHPKMSELDRMSDRTKATHLVVDHRDILKTIAGPAPSRAAVAMLQHYCNRPEDFYKQIISEQKKAVSKDGGASESDPDSIPEIKDIDRLLMTLEGAVNVAE